MAFRLLLATALCILFLQNIVNVVVSFEDIDRELLVDFIRNNLREADSETENLEKREGEECFFPFTYRGEKFSTCTSVNDHIPWCSLTSVYNGQYKYCSITDLVSTGGATYTRWGRKSCPETALLVYEGYAAGAMFDQSGSGSNYLCLPKEPLYDGVTQGHNAIRGLIYGAEYQMDENHAPENSFNALHDHDVPCSVCMVPRKTTLMHPARTDCPSADWTVEYIGYIMSERYSHHRTEFVCVDKEMEAIDGTSEDKNGALFYFTEGRCGSLTCSPYVEGSELTCAVCTI